MSADAEFLDDIPSEYAHLYTVVPSASVRARSFPDRVVSFRPPPSLPPRPQIAAVVVGFPATPLVMARVRFCVSAGHTRAELDNVLAQLEEIADSLRLRYRRSDFG